MRVIRKRARAGTNRDVAVLVIISDLHLTDGTSGATISPGAFVLFAEWLSDLAAGASQRADGRYRAIERVDLLLLGDILDLIRSTRWLRGTALRPWSDLNTPEAATFLRTTTSEILAHNETSLGVLRRMAQEGLKVPLARAGQSSETVTVPVRIHYLVGNHDWFFHLRGPEHSAIRQAVVRHMGLANRFDVPFPHDPLESDELTEVLRRHKVFARHGDMYDPFNFMGARDTASLGDAIVIELLNRFSHQVELELGRDLPTSTLLGLRELDNLRPTLLAPVWIDGLLERTCPRPPVRTAVKRIWDHMVDAFLELPFVRAQDTWSPTDLVDSLQGTLRFTRRLSLSWASSITNWLAKIRGGDDPSYYPQALAEPEFRNRRARAIVYGHTHIAETVPLDASFTDARVLNQLYFNSGTWRRVHTQTRWAPHEHEFIPTESMTYLAFFQGDERSGRAFETWTGTLAVAPNERATHRPDPLESPYGPGQSVSAPAIPGRGPHFAAPVARPVVLPARRLT
jgi:UDP-2,3-diacylglucosamine pyrophosphatase LpxH